MDTLRQDLMFALRSFRRSPGFTLIVTVTLALGIGAATAIFSVLNRVVLAPLPFRDQAQVLELWYQNAGLSQVPIALASHGEFAGATRRFAAVGAVEFHGADQWTVRDGEDLFTLSGTAVSGDFFRVLDVNQNLGRYLGAEDDRGGAEPVMVISHRLWTGRFGGSPRVIGRSLHNTMTGVTYRVVGVAPQGFEYPRGVDAWVPFSTFWPPQPSGAGPEFFVHLVGRLAPGATPEEGRAELTAFLRRQPDRSGSTGVAAVATPIATMILGQVRPALVAIMGAVLLLLLIACGNVANLLLVRGSARAGELAIRATLGAGRGRVVRQLLTESLLLAGLGGAGAVAVAFWLVDLTRSFDPVDLPRLSGIRVDASALLAALVLVLACTLLVGLLPALVASDPNLTGPLTASSSRALGSRTLSRWRGRLVVAQVAVTLVVLAGAGLLVRTLVRLESVDLGFDREHLVVAQASLPSELFGDSLKRLYQVMGDAVERVRAVPGVSGAALTALAPFTSTSGWFGLVSPAGRKGAGGVRANLEFVGEDYFHALGLPLLAGRPIQESDAAGSAPVVVVSRSLAQSLWPGESAIGKRVANGDDSAQTVVGVVADARYRDIRIPQPAIYIPYRQNYGIVPFYLLVRTSLSEASVVPAIRRAMGEADPNLALLRAPSMGAMLRQPLARPRFDALLLSGFAALALLLAATGLYGVLGATVRQRTHEIGIRMAVGARGSDILTHMLGRGLRLAGIGVVLGAAISLLVLRLLTAILYEVGPTDPLALGASGALLLAVSGLACWIPARAAARLDPVKAINAPPSP